MKPNSPKNTKVIRNNSKIFILGMVPSHIGIHVNETVYKLAVKATTLAITTQYEQTRSDLKAYINKTYKKVERKGNATQTNYHKSYIIYICYLTSHARIENGKDA